MKNNSIMSRFVAFVAVSACLAIAACATPDAQRKPVSGKQAATKETVTASKDVMSRADRKAITVYHNKVRRDVGVGPLKWSAPLAQYAQQWADHLAATTCRMKHRTQPEFGENLYIGTAGHYTAVDAAKAWETEKSKYAGGVLSKETWYPAGHYTQMVWRKTRALGCGESTCNGMLMVVCNYDPPGNYLGQSPY